jgi:hypothetical protein
MIVPHCSAQCVMGLQTHQTMQISTSCNQPIKASSVPPECELHQLQIERNPEPHCGCKQCTANNEWQ